jgi:DNA-binding transcriptional LysR family regulator
VLSVDRLRVLHAVATTGSVVGASAALRVTTSAVSQQLARLEREVGQPLLERHGRGVRLTDTGALLARDAADLLGRLEQVEAGLAAHRGAVTGTLELAAFATAARGLLPAALAALRARHPELTVTSRELDPHEAVPALTRRQLDLAVVQDWPDDPLPLPPDVSSRPLLDDRFDLAVPAGHPLAGRDTVAVGELAGAAWVSWPTSQICHGWLARTLPDPRVAHTASEHSTQLALVAAGLGLALIPRLGRDPVPPAVRLLRLEPAPVRRVFALWRTPSSSRPALAAVLTALAQAATPGRSC